MRTVDHADPNVIARGHPQHGQEVLRPCTGKRHVAAGADLAGFEKNQVHSRPCNPIVCVLV